jgi:hypothetical protein
MGNCTKMCYVSEGVQQLTKKEEFVIEHGIKSDEQIQHST